MKKIFLGNLIFAFLFFWQCATLTEKQKEDWNQYLYDYKGGFGEIDMKKRLKSEILYPNQEVWGLYEINKENCIISVDNQGHFVYLNFDEKGNIKVQKVKPLFPPVKDAFSYHSDNEHNVLWVMRGRGIYALDLETGTTGHCVTSADGNVEVLNSTLIDPNKKIFLIELNVIPDGGYFYILYDLINDEKIYESKSYIGSLFRFKNNKLLIAKFIDVSDKKILKWFIADYFEKEFHENKLTKKLAKYQLKIWERSKTIHLERRMMLGTARINKQLTYFSVRWDEKMEDIKIEPIIVQRLNNFKYDTAFEFSADGNWVKSIKYKTGFPVELVIFPVGEIYPQGLGMPILCGYTKELNHGAFMNHTVWGPCYVEQDVDYPDQLFVYKLADGMKLLAEEGMDSVQGE